MKKTHPLPLSLLTAILLFLTWSFAHSGGKDDKVYSTRAHLPIRESSEVSSKKLAEADWNEALSVLERKGRWIKIAAQKGEGWVYAGNTAPEKLPKENMNDLPFRGEGAADVDAARGLDEIAKAYGSRQSHDDAVEQIAWAEKLNQSITKEDARSYLKTHKLGEYSEAK